MHTHKSWTMQTCVCGGLQLFLRTWNFRLDPNLHTLYLKPLYMFSQWELYGIKERSKKLCHMNSHMNSCIFVTVLSSHRQACVPQLTRVFVLSSNSEICSCHHEVPQQSQWNVAFCPCPTLGLGLRFIRHHSSSCVLLCATTTCISMHFHAFPKPGISHEPVCSPG